MERRSFFATVAALFAAPLAASAPVSAKSVDGPRVPRTMKELKAMIEAEWPKTATSNRAIEFVKREGNSARLLRYDEKGEPLERCADALPMCHISLGLMGVYRSLGEIETRPVLPIFTEEDAARMTWFHYKRQFPVDDFVTDSRGILFVWRAEPEFGLYNGVAKTYMRASAVYLDRNGDMVVTNSPYGRL